jgi:hypothetical protein
MSPTPQPDPGRLEGPNRAAAKSSAVKAGWICLILGFLTFWIFGFGFIFFIATFILAIVAMSSNRVGQGIGFVGRLWHYLRDNVPRALDERFHSRTEQGTRNSETRAHNSSTSAPLHDHAYFDPRFIRTRKAFPHRQYQHSLSQRVGVAARRWTVTRR